jgi:hypothetical protein
MQALEFQESVCLDFFGALCINCGVYRASFNCVVVEPVGVHIKKKKKKYIYIYIVRVDWEDK